MIHRQYQLKISSLASIRLTLLVVIFTLLFSTAASARKSRLTHIVKKGDSIARIADFYSVSQRDLREMNGLSKKRPLKPGQKLKIPNVYRVSGKTYKVKKGDSLASIAAKFKRTAKEIAEANKISKSKPLRAGRTLIIPDRNRSATTIKIKDHKVKPIMFLRVRMGDRERIQLYYQNGKINKTSVKKLSYLARDKHGNKVKRLNFRLVKMIQLVSEKFPGKAIEIISGYRAQAGGNESQHAFGRAMDFRISGVAPKTIWQFCKTLPRSGCGYYPNSGFVHMDAREKKVTWIDTSP
jgi:uncharacterized protein YcbK (DUF882 family)